MDDVFHFCMVNNTVLETSKTGTVLRASGLTFSLISLLALGLGINYDVLVISRENRHKCGIFWNSVIVEDYNVNHTTFPYHTNTITFAARKPDFISNDWAFLKGFSVELWIALAVSIIAVSVAHYAIFRGRVNLLAVTLMVMGSLMGNAHSWRLRTRSQKMVVLFWNIGALFLGLSFCSVLLSIITVPKRGIGLETIDDVYQGIQHGTVRAVENRRTDYGNLFRRSESPRQQLIGNHLISQEKVNIWNTKLDEGVVAFGTTEILRQSFYDDRYFVSDDNAITWWYVGYDINKRMEPNLRERLNQVTERIWSSGYHIYFSSIQEHIGITRRSHSASENTQLKPLSMSNLAGVFVLLIGGYVLAGIVLLLEIYSKRGCSKQQRKQDDIQVT